MTASVEAIGAESTVTEPIEWRFNPWRERPGASWLALAITLSSLPLLYSLGVAPLGCVVLALALAATLEAVLLPVRCRVDAAGVARSGPFGWERRRWEDLRRGVLVRGGLLVSPFKAPRPLDRFRALLLPMPRAERAALRERIMPELAGHGLEPNHAS